MVGLEPAIWNVVRVGVGLEPGVGVLGYVPVTVVAAPAGISCESGLVVYERVVEVQEDLETPGCQNVVRDPHPVVPHLVSGRTVSSGIDVKHEPAPLAYASGCPINKVLGVLRCVSSEPGDHIDLVRLLGMSLSGVEIGISHPPTVTDVALIDAVYQGQFGVNGRSRFGEESLGYLQRNPFSRHDDVNLGQKTVKGHVDNDLVHEIVEGIPINDLVGGDGDVANVLRRDVPLPYEIVGDFH